MPEREILGRKVYDHPRRLIAGADCWLSEDERWIVAARTQTLWVGRPDPGESTILRWRAIESVATGPSKAVDIDAASA